MKLPGKLLRQEIKRGTILHSTMFEEIDHGKFFVVIGVSPTCVVGFFFINSNINRAIFKKQAQLDMQYPLRKKDYSFLRHDSFLCATQIIQRSLDAIVESIDKGEAEIIDQLKDEHINEVLEMLRNSKLFSKVEKATFFI